MDLESSDELKLDARYIPHESRNTHNMQAKLKRPLKLARRNRLKVAAAQQLDKTAPKTQPLQLSCDSVDCPSLANISSFDAVGQSTETEKSRGMGAIKHQQASSKAQLVKTLNAFTDDTRRLFVDSQLSSLPDLQSLKQDTVPLRHSELLHRKVASIPSLTPVRSEDTLFLLENGPSHYNADEYKRTFEEWDSVPIRDNGRQIVNPKLLANMSLSHMNVLHDAPHKVPPHIILRKGQGTQLLNLELVSQSKFLVPPHPREHPHPQLCEPPHPIKQATHSHALYHKAPPVHL